MQIKPANNRIKQKMINKILEHSSLYSVSELNNMSHNEIVNTYNSCLIPLVDRVHDSQFIKPKYFRNKYSTMTSIQKAVICLILIIQSQSLFSQSKRQFTSLLEASEFLLKSADSLLLIKDYENSYLYYTEGIKWSTPNASIYYNAACAAAMLGKNEAALSYIQKWKNAGGTEMAKLEDYPRLGELLKDTSKLNVDLVNIKKHDATVIELKNKTLNNIRDSLEFALDIDQQIRSEYKLTIQNKGTTKEDSALAAKMTEIDSINTFIVSASLDRYGWMDKAKLGSKAYHAQFIIIQHAHVKVQEKYYPIIKKAVADGKADSIFLPYLEDRINIHYGRLQVYGTQVGFNSEKKTYYVLPLEDPMSVDNRRSAFGLQTMQEYLSFFELNWNPELYIKNLPTYKKWAEEDRKRVK